MEMLVKRYPGACDVIRELAYLVAYYNCVFSRNLLVIVQRLNEKISTRCLLSVLAVT